MGGDAGQRRMQGGPDHPAGPAGLPMPPNMTHLMFQGPRLPHPQAPPPGELLPSCLSPAHSYTLQQSTPQQPEQSLTLRCPLSLQGALADAKISAAPA